jgi:hypothetical protein
LVIEGGPRQRRDRETIRARQVSTAVATLIIAADTHRTG